MEEFEYFGDVLADRHLLFVVIEHWQYGMPDFIPIFGIELILQWDYGIAYRYDILNLHESLLGCHIKPSLLLNRIVDVIFFEVLIYFGLPLIVNPGVAKHLCILFEYLLFVESMVDHIEHSIAEVSETADDDEFEGMLTEFMIKDFLLVRPVEYETGSILEMQFVVVHAVVLEEEVYEMCWIQEFFVSMKRRITSYHSEAVVYEL